MIVGKIGVEFASVVEYLEGKVEVEVLLAIDHRNHAFGEKAFGPGFDWESDGVRFEKGGVHDGKVVVRWVVDEGIHGGANDGVGKTDDGDFGEE